MLEATTTIVLPATGRLLERHFAQDGWGNDIEHPRPMFCETADGAIHTFTNYAPSGYTSAIYHHRSTDKGQTWTSTDITAGDDTFNALSLPEVRYLTCAAHGQKIVVMFYHFEKVFDGSVWSDIAALPFDGNCIFPIVIGGSLHLLFYGYYGLILTEKGDISTGTWDGDDEYLPPIQTYGWEDGEWGYSDWDAEFPCIVEWNGKLALSYLIRQSGERYRVAYQELTYTASFYDNFNRDDGALGDDWDVINGTCAIASNVAKRTSAVGRVLAAYAGSTYTDIIVEHAKDPATPSINNTGNAVRIQEGGACYVGYHAATGDPWRLAVYVPSPHSLTDLATAAGTGYNYDRLRLTVSGQTLTLAGQRAGTTVWDTLTTAADATYTTGDVGFFMNVVGVQLDDFTVLSVSSTPVLLDTNSIVGANPKNQSGWLLYPAGAAPLHVDKDGVLYCAWTSREYVDWADEVCVVENSGTGFGTVISRQFDPYEDPDGWHTGPFLTPALGSDERGIVYCLWAGYPPSGDNTVYFFERVDGVWTDDYGIATEETVLPDYIVSSYQQHALSLVHLPEGVLFSHYDEGLDGSMESDGTAFRLLTTDVDLFTYLDLALHNETGIDLAFPHQDADTDIDLRLIENLVPWRCTWPPWIFVGPVNNNSTRKDGAKGLYPWTR